jgi:hypothetical protein
MLAEKAPKVNDHPVLASIVIPAKKDRGITGIELA